MCKTLINRAKTICEVSNIDDELEHLRNVLKMNGYARHFIDNAMKTPQSIHQGPVVQKPINANLGLNLLNLGLNFNPRLLCVVQS